MHKFITAAFASALLILAVAVLPGCELFEEPKTKNPWNPEGPPLTADELEREADKRVDAAERWGQDEAEKLAREADARLAEFEEAVADLEGDTAAQLRDLKRQYEADARAAADASARITREIEATRRSASEKKLAGHADLAQKWKDRDTILGGLQMAAKSGDLLLPGLSGLLGTALGVVGGRWGSKKREDQVWDDSAKAAHDERDERDKTWDEAQRVMRPDPPIALLTTLAPALIAALRPGAAVTPPLIPPPPPAPPPAAPRTPAAPIPGAMAP